MKFKKALLGGLVAISVLASGLAVSADGTNGTNGHTHNYDYLYNRILQYQEKTGEHEVNLGGGKQAVCYIYKEYYEDIFYCNDCRSYVSVFYEKDDVHSISHY